MSVVMESGVELSSGSDPNAVAGLLARPNGAIGSRSGSGLLWKRSFDLLFSLGVIVVLLPVLLLIALAIKLDSRGPVLFKQKRWGRNQVPINVLKFRTMRHDLRDESGVAQTKAKDSRVTRVGAFLRSTSLDELPQFLNVLFGDMSVVGPRCHAIGMLACGQLYEDLVPEYHARHSVKPGITGLAQVRGWRGPTENALDAKARILCDLHYIENRTFAMDVWIVWETIRKEMFGGSGF